MLEGDVITYTHSVVTDIFLGGFGLILLGLNSASSHSKYYIQAAAVIWNSLQQSLD